MIVVFFTTYDDKQTRSLLGDLNGATDSNYAGSIAFALGCIHHRLFIEVPVGGLDVYMISFLFYLTLFFLLSPKVSSCTFRYLVGVK